METQRISPLIKTNYTSPWLESWPKILWEESGVPKPWDKVTFLMVSLVSNWDIGGLFIFWRRRQWQPTPVLLPGKSHGRRSLVGCSPWGRYASGMTERRHFHFSLSCIGEGNGNPLHWSCLENPRDCRAWWAAVYGVAQSQTRLKRLSSNSSRSSTCCISEERLCLYLNVTDFMIVLNIINEY